MTHIRSPWCRLYSRNLDNPKIAMLPRTTRLAYYELCALAAETRGEIASLEAAAFRMRVDVDHLVGWVDALIDAGLVERAMRHPHALRIAGWEHLQFVADSSTERVKKHRKLQRNGRRNTDRSADRNAQRNVTSDDGVTFHETEKPSSSLFFSALATNSENVDRQRVAYQEGNSELVVGGRAGDVTRRAR